MKSRRSAFLIGSVLIGTTALFTTANSQENIDRSATLRYTWNAPPADFDPPFAKNPYQLMGYAMPIYDTLIRIDAKGSIVPSLATSWRFSDDGLALTMQLREGVKFSDGSDLTAGVVVKSLNRTKNDPASLLAGQLKVFDSFEAPTSSTVVMRLKARDASVLYTLTSGAGMIVSGKALDDGVKLAEKPVGSGPYILVASSSQGATYERNETYFDKSQNQFAKVIVQNIPDVEARLNALQSGLTDIVLFQTEKSVLVRAAELVKTGRFRSYGAPSANTMPLYLNSKIPPFDNPKVRMALNLAVDRGAINTALMNDECPPASQPLPPGVIGHDPALATYKHDVAKAKSLLQEAGVKPFAFDVLVSTSEPATTLGVILKAQLESIGVTMNILPTNGINARPMFRTGKYVGLVTPLSVTSPDSATIIESAYLTPDTPGGVSPEFSKAVEEARAKPVGSPEREVAYKVVSKMAYDDPQHIFVCWAPVLVIYRPNVVGADKAPYLSAAPIADIRNYGMIKDGK